jgi:predicted neutral ceramidase superfamily lipid hydrolase
MSNINLSEAERLARIEAILERIEAKLDKVEEDQIEDMAELAELKNKGAGILIGVALVASAMGASLWNMITALFE